MSATTVLEPITASSKAHAAEAPKWTPPLDESGLRRVLELITAWSPLDVEAIYEDLDAAIGDQAPPRAATPELIGRLLSHLKRLSTIAVADTKFPPTADMVLAIERGRPLHDARLPAEHQQAVGMARRIAFVASDLLDAMLEARYIKDIE